MTGRNYSSDSYRDDDYEHSEDVRASRPKLRSEAPRKAKRPRVKSRVKSSSFNGMQRRRNKHASW